MWLYVLGFVVGSIIENVYFIKNNENKWCVVCVMSGVRKYNYVGVEIVKIMLVVENFVKNWILLNGF